MLELHFKGAIDIAFVGERGKFTVIYLDDMTVYSQTDEDHLKHLRKMFVNCRKFGISLNPKKSFFVTEEGKLLGHIISKEGVRVDHERVLAIENIGLPKNKKELQPFLIKINFLRRFIPNFAEVVKAITNMLNKDTKIKWTIEARIFNK